MTNEQTQEFKFKEPQSAPTFPQFQLYGRKIVGDITQQQASEKIGKFLTTLKEEVVEFELKNPTNPATVRQYGKIGELSAKVSGITTKVAISEAIAKLGN